jgi:hypothetical protein
MIRAVVDNGSLRPLDPLPPEWQDGRELTVSESLEREPESFEQWQRELEALIAEIPDDPEDRQRMQQVLEDADRVAKEFVRREMGL